MKFSCRAATISKPVRTCSLWIEAKSQFLHDTSDKVLLYNIPDKLIINAYQTPSKYVANNNVTMAEKRRKTLCEVHNGTTLPFQTIYKRKTTRSLPNVNFPDGFSLPHKEKHWSNETETIPLIIDVLVPYIYKE